VTTPEGPSKLDHRIRGSRRVPAMNVGPQVTKASGPAAAGRPCRPAGCTDGAPATDLGDDPRAFEQTAVIDRGGIAAPDRLSHQLPQPSVAVPNLVLGHRVSVGSHSVPDPVHGELLRDNQDM
jgi:hypothetical protein